MVDKLVVYPNAWGPFLKGSCHLTTDGPVEELHTFAQEKLHMPRRFFQDHPLAAHYDLTLRKREVALKAGAVFVSGREQAKAKIARRKSTS